MWRRVSRLLSGRLEVVNQNLVNHELQFHWDAHALLISVTSTPISITVKRLPAMSHVGTTLVSLMTMNW